MRPRGSVGGYVVIAFAGVGALVAVMVVLSFAVFPAQASSWQARARATRAVADSTRAVRAALTTSELAASAFQLTGDPVFRPTFEAARSGFGARMARLKATAPPDTAGQVAIQDRAGATWFAIAGRAVTGPSRPGAAPAGQLAAAAAAIVSFNRANDAMYRRLQADADMLAARGQSTLQAGLAWDVGLALSGTLFGLAVALISVSGISAPLANLRAVMQRRRAGDTSARARVAGTVNVRAVAAEFNVLADENDQFRLAEEHRARLRAVAREAGLRIREHLRVEDIVAETRAALGAGLDADAIVLYVATDGALPTAPGLDTGRLAEPMPPEPGAWAQEVIRKRASQVVQDLAGPEAQALPRWLRERERAAGTASLLLTPFDEGSPLAGVIAARRLRPGRPWTQPEVDALESVSVDLGRGLRNAKLYEEERHLVESLTEVNEMRTEFFTTVAHELRSPLTSIEGYVEMLSDGEGGPVTDSQRFMLEAVERSSTRLRALVEDLFTLARLESGAMGVAAGPVDMAAVMSGAVDAIRPAAEAAGLTFASSLPPGGAVVEGDAGQLDRALVNLLSNAVKFTPGGGHVWLTGEIENGWVTVTVRDTGIGVPDADQGRLFERFFRGSNAVERGIPGTGLGLAIVRAIVAAHHGALSMASREGEGMSVTLRLPVSPGGGP